MYGCVRKLCVSFLHKSRHSDFISSGGEIAQYVFSLLPARQPDNIFAFYKRDIRDAEIFVELYEQSGLPALVLTVVEQKIPLPVHNCTAPIFLFAAYAMAVLTHNQVGTLINQPPAYFLKTGTWIPVVFLSSVVENNHIIRIVFQLLNMIERPQRIERVCTGILLIRNGKLMLCTDINADFPPRKIKYERQGRLCGAAARAKTVDPRFFQGFQRSNEALLSLIHDVVVRKRKQINTQRLEPFRCFRRRNEVRAAFGNRHGLICQRCLQIKDSVLGIPQHLKQLITHESDSITASEQLGVALCRCNIRAYNHIHS